MSQRLVECVPNFSEGRDQKKIDQILAAIREVAGVEILDVDPGAETNRTVVTFVGAPEAAKEAAFRAIKRAAEVIDMVHHSGAHPRQGSTDVCPFVPIAGVTMQECVALATDLGRRVGEELGYPVYLYEYAARVPERKSLAFIRQGEYEGLPEKIARPEWRPDFGPAGFLPRVGAITIGARDFLIAYNINLNTRSKEHANDIAFELREKGRAVRIGQKNGYYSSGTLAKYRPSAGEWPCGECGHVAKTFSELEAHSRTTHAKDLREELAFFDLDPENLEGKSVMKRGLFAHCRAVGWMIPEYGRAQVSINLTNFHVTPMHVVLEATRDLARERGLVVTGSEIVGMVPFQALKETGEFYLARQGSTRALPARDVLDVAVQSLGLKDVGRFDIEKQVLGLPKHGALASMDVAAFADEVSRPTPAPGGGSVAALAGSLAASLASMVANLTIEKSKSGAVDEAIEKLARTCQATKQRLLDLIDADTDAFGAVLDAMRMPKGSPEADAARAAAIESANQAAAAVPLESARACLEALLACGVVAERGLAASITDAGVGGLMAMSGLEGAVLNVRINLGSITDQGFKDRMREETTELLTRGAKTLAALRSRLDL